jgi:hypothetical protein
LIFFKCRNQKVQKNKKTPGGRNRERESKTDKLCRKKSRKRGKGIMEEKKKTKKRKKKKKKKDEKEKENERKEEEDGREGKEKEGDNENEEALILEATERHIDSGDFGEKFHF